LSSKHMMLSGLWPNGIGAFPQPSVESSNCIFCITNTPIRFSQLIEFGFTWEQLAFYLFI
ncbi:MAG: hypothetical protein Q8755_02630, partial [Candidatus Phytoplasma australasiaticum]|nr:hypothetical protein [Candidatus Phytoplasma australasiaticum]